MKKILLVDDDKEIRDLIEEFVSSIGLAVISAGSDEEALSLLKSEGPIDGAIIDFWLSRGPSVGLQDRLLETTPNLPILVISGGDGTMSLETTQAVADISGAISFLQKPFTKQELIDEALRLFGS